MKKALFLLLLFVTPFIAFSQTKRAYKKTIKKHRKHYKKEFLEEKRSPFYSNKDGLKDIRFFKPKREYKLVADFRRTSEAKPFKMSTYSGITKDYVLYGIASVMMNGKKLNINVYQSLMLRETDEYKDYLFIPFKDITNDDITYGGGRYIDISVNDIKNGKVTIDFNRCYNPWCAFSDGYNCPVPPIENHFDIAINAGEKMYAGKH